MSSSQSYNVEIVESVEKIFENVISSSEEEIPVELWSSLIIENTQENRKRELYRRDLYDAGSGEVCTKYIPLSDSDVLRHVYYNYPNVQDPGILKALLESEPISEQDSKGQERYLTLCNEMGVCPVRRFYRGLLQEVIDLSYYGVNPVGLRPMSLALESNNLVKRLDLTSNYLSDDACYHIGHLLSENFTLKELVISQCRISAQGIRLLVANLSSREMDVLDLSKNHIGDAAFHYLAEEIRNGAVIRRLSSQSVHAIVKKVHAAKRLDTLDLSYNPLSPKDASDILQVMVKKSVKLINLLLEGIAVTEEFVEKLEEILKLSYRENAKITHGKLISAHALLLPDFREIVMKRISYLVGSKKKCKLDIALYFLEEAKHHDFMLPRELLDAMKAAKVPVTEDLADGIANAFPGPRVGRGVKTINLIRVADFIHRLWPDKKLPPTPPLQVEKPLVSEAKESKNKKDKTKAKKEEKQKLKTKEKEKQNRKKI